MEKGLGEIETGRGEGGVKGELKGGGKRWRGEAGEGAKNWLLDVLWS